MTTNEPDTTSTPITISTNVQQTNPSTSSSNSALLSAGQRRRLRKRQAKQDAKIQAQTQPQTTNVLQSQQNNQHDIQIVDPNQNNKGR
jgi:hypothetical protein